MREIVILKGVYGLRGPAGRVRPVARGERAAVSDEEAARLVGMGVAARVDGSLEPTSMDSLVGNSAIQAASDGGNIDGAETARLERLPKSDLERMARDLGVDLSRAKNNRERAQLLAAAEAPGGGPLPEPGTGDIVQ